MVQSFLSSLSIAQVAWPTDSISACLCDECGHSIFLDAQLLDFKSILDHSRSGHSPHASERESYLEMLTKVRIGLERCEIELRRLERVKQKVEKQKMLLQASEAGIKHVISPIQSLPLDILGVIFQYVCCGKDATNIADMCNSYSNPYYKLKKRLPTFGVSSVCSRWYHAVKSMPMLWTSFGINDYDYRSKSIIQTYLKRSRSNLIDFAIRGLTMETIYPPTSLFDHCDRWRHVFIAGPTTFEFVSAFLEPLVAIRHSKVPSNLISLSMMCYPAARSLIFPIDFPRLESLALSGFILDFQTPQNTITTLELSQMRSEYALSVLRKVPNIRSLTMDSISDGSLPTVEDHSIVLDKLQTLTLKFPLSNDRFLTAFRFPRLAHLYLDNSRQKFLEPQWAEILSFLNYCALTSLSIIGMSLSHDMPLQLLRRVPSLTRLDVEEWSTTSGGWWASELEHTTRRILELLVAPPQHQVGSQWQEQSDSQGGQYADLRASLLPRLVEVNLALIPPNELLLAVVRSRRPAIVAENHSPGSDLRNLTGRACLRTLRIRYPHPYYPNSKDLEDLQDLQESLRPFKEGGLDVVIE
ncbi:hypothetical protein EV361DRAFT_951950 [Lentinula raphanica]|nr:hypothetical protein EV361DRAFT_951950 [Lentinula raphanica]